MSGEEHSGVQHMRQSKKQSKMKMTDTCAVKPRGSGSNIVSKQNIQVGKKNLALAHEAAKAIACSTVKDQAS